MDEWTAGILTEKNRERLVNLVERYYKQKASYPVLGVYGFGHGGPDPLTMKYVKDRDSAAEIFRKMNTNILFVGHLPFHLRWQEKDNAISRLEFEFDIPYDLNGNGRQIIVVPGMEERDEAGFVRLNLETGKIVNNMLRY